MRRKTINLALGVHNHQPVGNFDHVLEHACERCYLPFFQVLENHPKVKFSVHFTGYLLSWIAEQYPEIIHVLSRLTARGQIELVTGAYYEPILAIIPDTDKQGQIKKLTDYLHELFPSQGQPLDVTGMWLAERVWEPHLPDVLHQCGIKYVCVDDSHFKGVGMSESELFRSYVTEEQGGSVEIFPINQKLRYLIPFESPSTLIEYLRSIASEGGERGAFYFDDGEKFGVWPGTYDTVYTHKWLEHFFAALEKNSDWIHLKSFGEYRRQIGPAGTVYLPTASYMEMMEWSLPADRSGLLEKAHHLVDPLYAPFLRGGFWRFFLVKYPEANNLHKKMLDVSRRLSELSDSGGFQPEALDQIRDRLWMGQSNDPYWHGVFGGLYLTNLRTANYQALVEAEAALERLEHAPAASWTESKVIDLNYDGQEEVRISTPIFTCLIAPAYGGSLVELDYKLRPFNLTDTLARRPEAYHGKLKEAMEPADETGSAQTIHGQVKVKEANLDEYLVYDWHRRLCFLDHFLEPGTRLDGLKRSQYAEKGDFVNQPYRLLAVSSQPDRAEVKLERQGHVWVHEARCAVRVEKTYALSSDSDSLKVSYRIESHADRQLDICFAPELNFNFLAPEADDRYFFDPQAGPGAKGARLSTEAVQEGCQGLGILDEWLGVKLMVKLAWPASLYRYPVYTVSNSEAGFERVYQGSAILAAWSLALKPKEAWSTHLELTVVRTG